MTDITHTLDQRKSTHGDWSRQAVLAQSLKNAMRAFPEWNDVPSHMRESLDMIAHKMSRAIIGDPMHHDHWHDIEGYARLISARLVPASQFVTVSEE